MANAFEMRAAYAIEDIAAGDPVVVEVSRAPIDAIASTESIVVRVDRDRTKKKIALPPDVQDVVDEEVMLLFDDLAEAQKKAIDGAWSMRCDWIVDRIVSLVDIGGVEPELRATQMRAAQHRDTLQRITSEQLTRLADRSRTR